MTGVLRPTRRHVVAVVLAALALAVVGAVAVQQLRPDEPVDHDVVAVLRAGADSSEPTKLTERIRAHCPDCRVRTSHADSDAATQARQFRDALAGGADVVVLEPVATDAAESLAAGAGDVPVIALGSLVPGASYYVGPHERALGRRLGRAVSAGARPGPVLVVEPPPAAAGVAAGLDVGLRGREVTRLEAPPAATREETRDWVAAQLVAPEASVAAVVAIGPAQALGVLDALAATPLEPGLRPAVATVGDDLESLRRLVRRQTDWSAHLDRDAEYDAAARLATSVVDPAEDAPETVDYQGVASVLTGPEIITLDNLADVMVRRHGVTISELCDRRTHSACEAAALL